MYKRTIYTLLFLTSFTILTSKANGNNNGELRFMTQLNYIGSDGKNAPYWLTALRQGISSIEKRNGYARIAASYSNTLNKNKNFSYTITADIIAGHNQSCNIFVQQAFAELKWKWISLSIGSKERFSEAKGDYGMFEGTPFAGNNVNRYFPNLYNTTMTSLSSGGLTYSGNSRPVPQIRIEVPEYTPIPWFNGWLHIRGHIAYGRFTDDNFQEEHSHGNAVTRYGKNIMYHSKAAFIKIGKPQRFPLEFEGGLELYSQFGGDIYKHNIGKVVSMPRKPLDYIKAFIPLSGGDDTPLDEQTNISGNQTGSWHAAITLHTKPLDIRIYGEHLFEDFSQLFFLEYQSNKEGKKKIIYYPWRDLMIGIRITNKSGFAKFISAVQYEYMSTYDQSGPLYHDPSPNFNEQMDGVDNYYNHGIYPGWHHWGMGMGNPLIISPAYNKDGDLAFKSNRLVSHNVGINGTLGNRLPLTYRLQYTYSENWGTYLNPFREKTYTTSMLGELVYAPEDSNWLGSLSIGYDKSSFIGDNIGAMITITHVGLLKFNKKK